MSRIARVIRREGLRKWMPLGGFVFRRLLLLGLVLLAMTFLTFTMVQVLPGDPARTAAGRTATPEQVEQARERLGLDEPIPMQYWRYLSRLLRGDLGVSVVTQRPVSSDIARVLPASAELVLIAMLLNLSIAIPLGILAAVRGRVADGLVRGLVMFGYIPVFWLALMLQFVFAGRLRWFPLTGRLTVGVDAGQEITGLLLIDTLLQGKWTAWSDALWHLVLPAVALAAGFIAVMARTTRSTMLGAMSQDYITLARSKGIRESRVVLRHGARNAMVPSVTILGMQLGWMLGATVLVERIYGRTGIGSYAVDAVLASDVLAVVAVALVIGVIFTVANLLVDLAYLWLNPVLRTRILLGKHA